MKLLILSCILAYTQGAIIALVEYQPVSRRAETDGKARVLLNILEYVKEIVHLENQQKLDLIVFPESTLEDDRETSFEINIGTTCSYKSGDPLDAISCLAKSYQTYIVINLIEKLQCDSTNLSENCRKFGYSFYNTNVVFDRNGTIITRYRKYNLFGEYTKDQPNQPDLVTFETDFNLKLGTFTCFDILFKSPAQELVGEIDGAVFPSMWFSELPFLTALQTQQMWAHEHNVTLLAAGANNPLVGSGGSGVYLGAQGAALSGIVAEGGTKAFVYETGSGIVLEEDNVDDLGEQMDGFYLKRDKSVDEYIAVVLDTSKTNISQKICHKEKFCCEFSLKVSTSDKTPNKNSYIYQLVAFSGVRSFDGVYYGGIEVCGIIFCRNTSLSTCGYRFPKYEDVEWPVTFEEIQIVADFQKTDNKTQFPNSLLSSIKPIHAKKTVWEKEEREENGKVLVRRKFSISEKQDRLLTFAIYGRDFDWDFPPPQKDNGGVNSGRENAFNFLIISLSCLFLHFIK